MNKGRQEERGECTSMERRLKLKEGSEKYKRKIGVRNEEEEEWSGRKIP